MPQSRLFAETDPECVGPMLVSVARDLRDRAEEVLARADTYHDADAREKMHRIAWDYEKLGPAPRNGVGRSGRGVSMACHARRLGLLGCRCRASC